MQAKANTLILTDYEKRKLMILVNWIILRLESKRTLTEAEHEELRFANLLLENCKQLTT